MGRGSVYGAMVPTSASLSLSGPGAGAPFTPLQFLAQESVLGSSARREAMVGNQFMLPKLLGSCPEA